jgi:hypothetical protein
MGAHDGANRNADGAERWERVDAEIAGRIALEMQVRDEFLTLLDELERLPPHGPVADGFRDGMREQARELRPMIEGRLAYLSGMPPVASLVPAIDLDDPDVEAQARQLALMVEGASACFAALAVQVQLFAEMRRRGLPV